MLGHRKSRIQYWAGQQKGQTQSPDNDIASMLRTNTCD
jgi:hypothetical protein